MAISSREKIKAKFHGQQNGSIHLTVTFAFTVMLGLLLVGSLCERADAIQGPKRLLSKLSRKEDKTARESVNPKLQPLLDAKDSCGTVKKAASNGYLIKSYTFRMDDNYELTLHRLIHPEDVERGEPRPGSKKPYMLLHGLIGSSASFMMNSKVDPAANSNNKNGEPRSTYKIHDYLDSLLKSKRDLNVQQKFLTVAAQFEGLPGIKEEDLKKESRLNLLFKVVSKGDRDYADFNLLNFDYDKDDFGQFYRRQYMKTQLPTEAKAGITNSLAMTLSNFGYDVWMLNLRGNSYSKSYHGAINPHQDPEYWNFNSETLVREDLLASINFVRKTSLWRESLGLVSYSYSSALILNMLTRHQNYAELIQPIVFMAPGPMTSTHEHGLKRKIMAATVSKVVAHTGAFPDLGRKGDDLIVRTICGLPFAKNLCNLFEIMLHGQLNSMSKLVVRDLETQAIQQDAACGQTSTPVLRDIMSHMSDINIDPAYSPSLEASRRKIQHRRSVMLVHSKDDPISTPTDVKNLADSALKSLALVDYVINEPEFGHTSFLFSKKNHFLVNGEIVRMVSLFDLLTLPKPLLLQRSISLPEDRSRATNGPIPPPQVHLMHDPRIELQRNNNN